MATVTSLTNYCSFVDTRTGKERIGHFDEASSTIQPLAYRSGSWLTNLYEVIEVGEDGIIPSGEPIKRSSTKILAPINGRDILCVGKNYAEHAKEFNKSGYDSSDKVDQPTHPVIFTKRFSSIIADGDDIYPHPEFTQTADYEGELGVIIGKPGFRISQENAMDHVWGYTIINDMTARERQRDHKQFYIGKSPDTFCPMGPFAVPAGKLDKELRVQTTVNGELRQDATTQDLIFSIPYLIKTLSEGQTLMPGDVLATGTPAGVGVGRDPPVYLKPGDEVVVSVTGLGKLTNRISAADKENPTLDRMRLSSSVRASQVKDMRANSMLHMINGKPTHLRSVGNESGRPAIFIHGLGGTGDFWSPLIQSTKLREQYHCHLFDFEGQGLSPTSPLSKLSIASLANDVKSIYRYLGLISGAAIFAHSMGCLVALDFVLNNPSWVNKLVLLGPPPSPLPEAGSKASHARAELARTQGMEAVADTVATAGTSDKTKRENQLAFTAVKLSLLGQDPEGYAKACTALAEATNTLDVSKVKAETYIITGAEDKVSPPQLCHSYQEKMPNVISVQALDQVGHWHVFEDLSAVGKAVEHAL